MASPSNLFLQVIQTCYKIAKDKVYSGVDKPYAMCTQKGNYMEVTSNNPIDLCCKRPGQDDMSLNYSTAVTII